VSDGHDALIGRRDFEHSRRNDNVRAVTPSVIVSGIGIVSAFGTTHASFRDGLMSGQTRIARVRSFGVDDAYSTLAAEITDFDPTPWVAPMKMRRLDRTGVYAIAAAKLALDDAGATLAADGEDDAGVVLGTWTAGGQSTQQFLDALFRKGPTGAPALLFDSTVGNSAASITGLELKLRGPNVTVSHKEASGLSAVVTGVDHLREGRARAVLAGGVDAVYETFYKGHDKFKVMSPATAASAAVAPFDASRAGFVLGEGGFELWLERHDGASAARAHGEILGVSASSAAVSLNRWPDRHEALVRTMRLAIEDGGLMPADVDVIYASANATPGLDAVEATAIDTLFGDLRPLVTSIKGALGEFGAVGSAACAAAFICGRAGQVPPIAGFQSTAPEARSLRLVSVATPAPGPVVLVNSFASGGALFSAVLRVAR
jgi:3-oxoacyl-[acyl-carrier-protein] synthase II